MEQAPQETLTPKEKSRAWWGGFFKGLIEGIPVGIAVAVGAALLLGFVAIPLLPTLAGAFGPFITFPSLTASLTFIPQVATVVEGVATTAAFFPLPLMIFNTALTMAGNALGGANNAVAVAQQKADHEANEARIERIEARGIMVEQAVVQTPKIVESILARGARRSESFSAAEQARAADAANQSKAIN